MATTCEEEVTMQTVVPKSGPERYVFLLAPRQPNGQAADRRWTLLVSHHYQAEYITLIGTTADDVEGAKQAAAQELGYSPEWQQLQTGSLRAESRA
jgi:hypothetical protein